MPASTEARARSCPKKLLSGLIRLVELGILTKSGIWVSCVAAKAVLSSVGCIAVCSKALGNKLIFACVVFVGVLDKVVAVI